MQHYMTYGPFCEHKHAMDQADWLEKRGFLVIATRKQGKDGKARTTVRAYREEKDYEMGSDSTTRR